MLRGLHRMIRKAMLHGGTADDPRARGDGTSACWKSLPSDYDMNASRRRLFAAIQRRKSDPAFTHLDERGRG